MSLESRLAALEAEVFCVVSTTANGHVFNTGCDHGVDYKDWSDKERCPHCGRRLLGHDDVRPIE